MKCVCVCEDCSDVPNRIVRDPASRLEGLEGRGQRHRADNGRKVIGLDMRRSTTCVW